VKVIRGEFNGCTGYFLSVQCINGSPKALVELHHSPNEGCNIHPFSFDEIVKETLPVAGQANSVTISDDAYEHLLNDIEEMEQQLHEIGQRIRCYKTG
jgi:hypothetical protein